LAGEFLCAFIFGFVAYRIFGEDKPMHELEVFWGICTPFLFGTIGASLDFEKIDKSSINGVLAMIFIGVTFRTVAAYFSIYEK